MGHAFALVSADGPIWGLPASGKSVPPSSRRFERKIPRLSWLTSEKTMSGISKGSRGRFTRSGGRSAVAADVLGKMGYTNVSSLAGGLAAYEAAGLPVDSTSLPK